MYQISVVVKVYLKITNDKRIINCVYLSSSLTKKLEVDFWVIVDQAQKYF